MGMDGEVEGRENGWCKWINDGIRGWRNSEDHMTYVLRLGTDRNLLGIPTPGSGRARH